MIKIVNYFDSFHQKKDEWYLYHSTWIQINSCRNNFEEKYSLEKWLFYISPTFKREVFSIKRVKYELYYDI